MTRGGQVGHAEGNLAGTSNRPSRDSGTANGGQVAASIGRTARPDDPTDGLNAPIVAILDGGVVARKRPLDSCEVGWRQWPHAHSS